MKLIIDSLKDSLDKRFKFSPIQRTKFDNFKSSLTNLYRDSEKSLKENQTESHFSTILGTFLTTSFYENKHHINTKSYKGQIECDLVIYDKHISYNKSEVLIEIKKPGKKDEMISQGDVHKKSFYETILYYLYEKIILHNDEVKKIIITDLYDWYIFNSTDYYHKFIKDKHLVDYFKKWESGELDNSTTDQFYTFLDLHLKSEQTEIKCCHFNLLDYKKFTNEKSENKLVPIYHFLSDHNLLKKPFKNDFNFLRKEFYYELLYIIGLEEFKKDNKKFIGRCSQKHQGTFLEGCISVINSEGLLSNIDNPNLYGESEEDQVFNISLELSMTWVNRIIFLKLLENQLQIYNNNSDQYKFLNYEKVNDYDRLNSLFFKILSVIPDERVSPLKEEFCNVPFLNSSLFESTTLEKKTIRISNLEKNRIQVYKHTILKEEGFKGKPLKNKELDTLEYLLSFLNCFDFGLTTKELISDDVKPLINSSVLGMIFEKINGYKEGSVFTPSFITMYMSKNIIRKKVLEKFNEQYEWECQNFLELHNKLENIPLEESEKIFHSIKICDMSVGSGHFLVSCLNEFLSIKSELGILYDKSGKKLFGYKLLVENDELTIEDYYEQSFLYQKTKDKVVKEKQRLQETIFSEKKKIIEGNLFGVDINPNSVNICCLRLWIELLKFSYYTEESSFQDLETLPNLELNIKVGNSLISKFSISDNLKSVFEGSEYSFSKYKQVVSEYKNTNDKVHKQFLKTIISEIKGKFSNYIDSLQPLQKELSKLRGQLFKLDNNQDIFGDKITDPSKIQFERERIRLSIKKIEKEVQDIKSRKINLNQFEWRIEFPEILSSDGDFEGFDLIIGNPPFVDIKSLSNEQVRWYTSIYKTTKNRINLYSIFLEKGHQLLKKKGFLSLIIPNSILMNSSYSLIRNLLLDNVSKIIKLPDRVFHDMSVETIIIEIQKDTIFTEKQITIYKNNEKIDKIEEDRIEIIKDSLWKRDKGKRYNLYTSEEILTILDETRKETIPLGEICDFSLGITPYDSYTGHSKSLIKNREFHSDTKKDESYKPLIKGENILNYIIDPKPQGYIKYGNWLGSKRNERFFTEERLIIRQIVSSEPPNIFCGYTNESLYFTQIGFGLIIKKTFIDKITYPYLCSLINSKLLTFFHKYKYLDLEKTLFQKILIENTKMLPIKLIDIKNQDFFKTSVKEIIQLISNNESEKISQKQKEIDNRIFSIYELSSDEIRFINSKFP